MNDYSSPKKNSVKSLLKFLKMRKKNKLIHNKSVITDLLDKHRIPNSNLVPIRSLINYFSLIQN